MKTLYKKDSKGKIRIWNVWTDTGILYQSSGLLDGKLVTHSKVCLGKNVGKSNETDVITQSNLEMQSEINSKLTEGYFQTKEEAENELVILPMLAKSYDEEKHKIDWTKDVFIQSKLDGMRCLAHISNGSVKLVSRDGKIIENMQHIIDDLIKIKEDVILDGELYAHGKSFQENMRLIKKYRKGETEEIKYHIYDVVSSESYNFRKQLIDACLPHQSHIKSIRTVISNLINSEKDLKIFHSANLYNGYEGSILRHGDEPYKVNGRSSSLLKYKDFSDVALEIIDITANEANPLHGTPHFELNGKTFKAGCKMSHDDREDLLRNKKNYIGKTAEIRYFELTDDGIPRFPVCVGIRLDK